MTRWPTAGSRLAPGVTQLDVTGTKAQSEVPQWTNADGLVARAAAAADIGTVQMNAELHVNSWNQCYAADDYYFGTEPNDLLLQHHSVIRRGGDVLCLAEGEGRNAVFLAHEGYRVVAVDQSAVGLQKAKRLAATKGAQIQTVVADLCDYRIEPSSWDGIVSIWCHFPRSLRVAVHLQVVAGLKPGGVFVLEAYTPAQIGRGTGGPPTGDRTVTLPELRRELKGLDLVRALERERVVHEGSEHDGLSAVVQIVARKRL